MRILGQITRRLIAQHGENSPAWNPTRPADTGAPKSGKLPKGVQGKSLGGRGKK
jgi:hypothetical protein